MRTYSGPFLTEDGFIQAEINVEDISGRRKIIDFEEGGDSGEQAVVIPTLYDTHIHSADSVVKEVPEGTIAEIVGPGGFKHKELARASREEKIEAMRDYFLEMLNNGIRDLVEFREGGIEGLSLIREAVGLFGDALRARIMTRPVERRFDEDELEVLLSNSDGIGVSSYRDWEEDELIKVAEMTRDMKKPFAMHCSEDEREPIDKVLGMDVHHLVHMLEANMDDLEACAEEDVPVVICPRSNMYFDKMPDIPMMLRSGVTLALGTDNAMLADPDMFNEMKSAYRVAKKNGGVPSIDILKMATLNPRKALNYPSDIQSHQDADTYLIMEPGQGDTSYELVTRSSAKEIIEIVEW